jgi:hypothetical protein
MSRDEFHEFTEEEWAFAFDRADALQHVETVHEDSTSVGLTQTVEFGKTRHQSLIEGGGRVTFFGQFARVYNPIFDNVERSNDVRSKRLSRLQKPLSTTTSVEEARLDMIALINQVFQQGGRPYIVEKFVEVDREKKLIVNSFRLKEYNNINGKMLLHKRDNVIDADNVGVCEKKYEGTAKIVTPAKPKHPPIKAENESNMCDETKESTTEAIVNTETKVVDGNRNEDVLHETSTSNTSNPSLESEEQLREEEPSVAQDDNSDRSRASLPPHFPRLPKGTKELFTKEEKGHIQTTVCGFLTSIAKKRKCEEDTLKK